jgi:NADP-dependent 3-hydroxy acid dehydrogenase YdfG
LKELGKNALTPNAIARLILFVIAQPDEVDVSEIIIRPTASPY